MAWLYSCAIWITLINISAPSHEAMRRSRAVQRIDDSASGIVFPGQTSFKPKIPKDCETVGICDNIPEYPHGYVSQLVDRMSVVNLTKFNVDVIEPQIAQRIGPEEENLELCRSEESLYNPKAAKDTNEQWYYIINKVKDIQQTFRVDICHRQNVACKSVVHFAQGYEGMCKQKYILRSMVALDYNGEVIEKHFLVPSCCSCIYRVTELKLYS
ncbi:PREDICTED: uncharacterized protein LOC106115670 [Papilio xuthus]|uniref:Uncharacterized protein LOC106115670 n=1 Tax=Papilio xuthus TaxID=66420 RepID=A0AAJ6Z3C7_PAPXU|nr:PREDICTED: uncharacterized protein LOC106115670 [Papilio xuthus]